MDAQEIKEGTGQGRPAVAQPHYRPRSILCGLAVLACVQPLAQTLSRRDWRADLLSHFPEPALLFTLILFAVAARRRSLLAVALAALAAWQTTLVFRYTRPNPVVPAANSSARLKVLMANVLLDNDRYQDLARLIRRERPDIVGLVEYTDSWQANLEDMRAEFACAAEYPAGASGLALWFRRAPVKVDPPARLRPSDRPFLHAQFEFAGHTRDLWLIHPRQPLDPVTHHAGNRELAAIGDWIGRAAGYKLVMGDFNTSEGSRNFAAFVSATHLRDSRYGFGRQGSFPAFSPYRIAIDHALVSDDLAVVDRRLGPPIGSDHYPLIFELAPASEPTSAVTSASRASQSSP